MTWSLQVDNGDISYGTQGLNTVTDGNKLVQDLGCYILEPMGTDPLHPDYGSIIDGGVDANGVSQPGIIGAPNDSVATTFVSAEIKRICSTYQSYQLTRNDNDIAVYGKSTLTAPEMLLGVEGINIQTVEDAMQVTVTLDTGGGVTALVTLIGTS